LYLRSCSNRDGNPDRAISGLWSAPAWTTASMPWVEKARSTTALSTTEPTTWVSAPGAMSRPIATWPAARSRGARNRPSHPDEPVSRTRITKPLRPLSGTPNEYHLECFSSTISTVRHSCREGQVRSCTGARASASSQQTDNPPAQFMVASPRSMEPDRITLGAPVILPVR
jgi:hypothetical protein